MTLTIDLPDDALAALRADAEANGRDVADLAAERLAEMYLPLGEDEDDLVAAVNEALDQLDAGQHRPLEEFAAELEARFGERRQAQAA